MTPSAFPDRGSIRFLKPRDVGDLLNATVAFVRQNARELLLGVLAIAAPVALAAGISQVLALRSMRGLFTFDPATTAPEDILGAFGPSYFTSVLFGIVTQVVLVSVVGAFVRLYREGRAGEVSVGVLWEETKRWIGPIALLLFVLFAAFVGSILLVAIPCLGLLVYLGGMVYLTPVLHVMLAVRFVEETSVGESFRRARELVKGSWWPAFLAVLLTWIVAVLLGVALYIPLTLLMGLAGTSLLTDPEAMTSSAMAIVAIPMQVAGTLLYVLPLVVSFFLHGRLSDEMHGTGLWDDLDTLAGRPEAGTAWETPSRPTPADATTPPGSDADESARDESADDDPAAPPPPPSGFRGGGFSDAP